MKSFSYWILPIFCLAFMSAKAQYDPANIFVTNDFYNHQGNTIRSASGKPGPDYWQNEAVYSVEAAFDVKTKRLTGKMTIDYTNNSPDKLDFLWLQLDQNTTKAISRRNRMKNPGMPKDSSQGYHIKTVELRQDGKKSSPDYKVFGTRMQLRLAHSINPGEKIRIEIPYSYILQPKGGGFRSGYMDSENGKLFEFSYWYPRMCVYDDYYGWNTLPFIGGGEMYLDYGTIDYKLTVPAGQVVVGSGVLVNKDEILNDRTLNRLKKASRSDKTVFIRRPDELGKPVTKAQSGTVTWHFRMENTRDVAWAMSKAYIWDAAKIDLPDGKTALAQSVYPIESTLKDRAWVRSTEMLKASVEFFSNKIFPYPYKMATSVAGTVGGMEFPGLVFNYWGVKKEGMYLLASHEIGHTWFPMIVGSDERRNPFMDEGFNVFWDIYAQKEFNHGEFAPKRDGEYAPGGGNPADEIIKVIKETQGGPTIMTAADDMPYKFVHPLMYFKTAFGLVLLREVILGPDKFDYAFDQYVKNWTFKHPRPADFFRSMENGSGENLSWFWQGWFYHNWLLDQAVKGVSYIDDDPKKGAEITISNKKQMVMPILIEIEEENGKTHNLKIPVDVWKYGAEATFSAHTSSKIKKIVLDPEHQLPDSNRTNNLWVQP